MMTTADLETKRIQSFTCRCVLRKGDLFLLEPSPRMFRFFGTTQADYEEGIITRIGKKTGEEQVASLHALCREQADKGEDFCISCWSKRSDGTPCYVKADGCVREKTADGPTYEFICMDITAFVEARTAAEQRVRENSELMRDLPVGLAIWHIRGFKFELIYTNEEYYRIHHSSKAYWDSLMKQDVSKCVYHEDLPALLAEYDRVIHHPGQWPVFDASYRCCGENGTVHWIRIIARFTTVINGEGICYAAYIDVDREKEEGMQTAEAQRNIINTISSLPSTSVLFRMREQYTIAEVVSFSDEFCRMTGVTQNGAWQFYSGNVFRVVHEDQRALLQAAIYRHSSKSGTLDTEYQLLLPTGCYIWVLVKFSYFTAGNEHFLYGDFTNVDEIRARGETLARQYEAAQTDLESLSQNYLLSYRVNLTANTVKILHDRSGLFQGGAAPGYDDFTVELMQYLPRAQDRQEFQTNFSRQGLIASYQTGFQRISQEYYIRLSSGRRIWVRRDMNIRMHPDSNDLIGFVIIRDISANRTFQILMDEIVINQYDFIANIDAEYNIIYLIRTNEQRSCIREVQGDSNYDTSMRMFVDNQVIPEDQEACTQFTTLSQVEQALEHESHISTSVRVKENGRLRYKRLDYFYLDREVGLLTMSITDVTELQQKQMKQEERLHTALNAARQASVAKSQFLSRMSHEIRTPMNAIIGFDTIALQEPSLPEATRDALNKIGVSAKYLLSLINDILDMSRIESGRMLLRNEKFYFRRFIDSINTMFIDQCQDKGLQYDCLIKGYAEEFYIGDETKLQQILVNILGNAVKFTPAGGKLKLVIEQLSQNQHNARMQFTIADTGIGIDEEFQPQIFIPFSQENAGSTSQYSGTGLGLAICKSLVHLMDGHIDVYSVKGRGTTFTVNITLEVPEDSQSFYTTSTISDLKGLQTLIVDDNIIDCQHTAIVLKEAGILAEWVNSGRAAVEKVRRRHSKKEDYELIIIDRQMPEMDGIETARAIRRIVGSDVTSIILTAYDWSEIGQSAGHTMVDGFINKPVFASAVAQAYDEARLQNQPQPAEKKKFNFQGLKLLVAEDNEINAEIARELLEIKGAAVTVVGDGREVVRAFTESAAGEYAAILMDIRMPYIDGLEAARMIRCIPKADNRSIPIIAMSANAFEEDIQKSLNSGMNAHLSKPIDTQLMYETLSHLIYESRQKDR